MAGFFIVIDGGNGSGKKTQCDLLVKRLEKEGFEVAYADFPQHSNPSCFFVDKYLNGEYGHPNEVGPYTASIFFALDRYDDSKRIRNELARGRTIVSNRYVSANIGHQGGKIQNTEERNKYLDWLLDFEFNIMKNPKPDVTMYLHVLYEIGDKLVEKRGNEKDEHEKDPEHSKNAEEAFLYAARKYGWPIIECITQDNYLKSREVIHEEIWKVLQPLLYK